MDREAASDRPALSCRGGIAAADEDLGAKSWHAQNHSVRIRIHSHIDDSTNRRCCGMQPRGAPQQAEPHSAACAQHCAVRSTPRDLLSHSVSLEFAPVVLCAVACCAAVCVLGARPPALASAALRFVSLLRSAALPRCSVSARTQHSAPHRAAEHDVHDGKGGEGCTRPPTSRHTSRPPLPQRSPAS